MRYHAREFLAPSRVLAEYELILLRPDFRVEVETHDGASLYMQYTGLLEMNAVVQAEQPEPAVKRLSKTNISIPIPESKRATNATAGSIPLSSLPKGASIQVLALSTGSGDPLSFPMESDVINRTGARHV